MKKVLILIVVICLFYNCGRQKHKEINNIKTRYSMPTTTDGSLIYYYPNDFKAVAELDTFIFRYKLKEGWSVHKLLEHKKYFFKIVEEKFKERHLPVALKYLAIIESSVNPNDSSRFNNLGIWQLDTNEAKKYGIYKWEDTTLIDERKNMEASTVCFANVMKGLNRKYKDWLLVMVAYNAGEGTLHSAIKKSGGSKNYWDLDPFLPQETKLYIRKAISMLQMENN